MATAFACLSRTLVLALCMIMPKLLKVALEERRYDLAAHALVYGLVSAKQEQKQHASKERCPKGQPERQKARILQQGAR